MGFGTGQLQDARIAGEVTDHPVAAEGQPHGDDCLSHRLEEAEDPGGSRQQAAEPVAHQHGVPKGPADGQVAIVGHDGKRQTLCGACRQTQTHLERAAKNGDGLLG